jgi:hypothetical protein
MTAPSEDGKGTGANDGAGARGNEETTHAPACERAGTRFQKEGQNPFRNGDQKNKPGTT